MERSGSHPPEPEVPLADAGIAAEIARIAARGRGSDRAPTLEQLLAAFQEPEATDAARQRVAAAMRVAGVGVTPDVLDAEPGQRMLLRPPGATARSPRGRALGGLALLAAVVVAAVLASTLLGADDDGGGGRAIDDLPATSTVARADTTATSTATTPRTTPTRTTTTPAATTETETTPAESTPAETTPDAGETAEERRAAAARRPVSVRVDATGRPTFLCVDDGAGTILFNGTLDGRETFRGRHVRLNVGLASTEVRVNGSVVALDGSPAGLDVTRSGGVRPLPLGQRPCA